MQSAFVTLHCFHTLAKEQGFVPSWDTAGTALTKYGNYGVAAGTKKNMPITQIDAVRVRTRCSGPRKVGKARELGEFIWKGSRGDIAKIACVAEMRRVRNEEKSHKR